jgi:hypothetical protein
MSLVSPTAIPPPRTVSGLATAGSGERARATNGLAPPP